MTFGIGYGLILLLFVFSSLLPFHKRVLPTLLLFDFAISFLAYFVKTPSFGYWDTIRFSQFLDQLRGFNSLGTFNGLKWGLTSSYYAQQPVVVMYLWVFSLFKNDGMLFCASAFFFLFSLSLLIIKSKKELNCNPRIALFTQILILATFNIFFQIEGIRNFLAFILFSTSLYFDLSSNNKQTRISCWFFYILAFSIHPSVFPLIIFRAIIATDSKIVNRITYIILLTYTFFLNPVINFISNFAIFNLFTEKSQDYLYGQSNYRSFAGGGEILFTSFIFICLVLEFLFFNLYNMKENLSAKYITFYKYVIFFTLGSFLNTQVYLRMIMLLLFLSVPIKMLLLSKKAFVLDNDLSKSIYAYKVLVVLFAILMFFWWNHQTYSQVLL